MGRARVGRFWRRARRRGEREEGRSRMSPRRSAGVCLRFSLLSSCAPPPPYNYGIEGLRSSSGEQAKSKWKLQWRAGGVRLALGLLPVSSTTTCSAPPPTDHLFPCSLVGLSLLPPASLPRPCLAFSLCLFFFFLPYYVYRYFSRAHSTARSILIMQHITRNKYDHAAPFCIV